MFPADALVCAGGQPRQTGLLREQERPGERRNHLLELHPNKWNFSKKDILFVSFFFEETISVAAAKSRGFCAQGLERSKGTSLAQKQQILAAVPQFAPQQPQLERHHAGHGFLQSLPPQPSTLIPGSHTRNPPLILV